jgi:hypothetical protein
MNKEQLKIYNILEEYDKDVNDIRGEWGCEETDNQKETRRLLQLRMPSQPTEITPLVSTHFPNIVRRWYGKCPNCGKMIMSDDHHYFHDDKDCGQALAWGTWRNET